MPRQISIARRNLLKGAGALAAGIALQRAHLIGAQDASPTAEPQEVTYSQPVEGKTNVSWWSHNGPPWVDGNIKMITAFQEANPDINIVYQYFPYEVLISKLQAGYNSGTVADMQQMFGTWVTDYAAFGLLDPVPAEFAEGFADRFWEASIGAFTYNEQYYGMPKEFNIENGGMLVNPDIVEAEGISAQPATWQELIDTQAGFMFTRNDPLNFLFLAMILQQGATYWADDGVHVNFQTDAAKKAWQDEVDLVVKYHVDDETSYAGQDINFFFQGHAAYSMTGPWVIPEGENNYPDMNFTYVPMPPYAGTDYVFAAESGWGEVVNVNAAPEIKAAAWKFIDFMTQPDNLRVWNLATYTLPSLKSMQNDPQILEVAPLLKVSFDVLPYGKWVGPVHNRDRFWESIHVAFTAASLGQMDAPSALTRAEQEINAMIDEMVGP
ncbi:MAG: extracellular solute-binding protein family 1 [Thermomicrobiales bacterium]|nr:extracellular solute-binding protein family 1 [Thermomicrobiales bacterium]